MMDAMPMSGVIPTIDVGNGGSNNNGGAFGGDWSAWIVIILFALIFGWGNNGFGGNGGNGMTSSLLGLADNYGRGFASPQDVSATVGRSDLESQIRGVTNGLCDGFYAVNTSLLNGFANTNQAIANLGYQTQQCCCDVRSEIAQNRYDNAIAINGLSSQLATCCCGIEKAISDQNFLNAQNTNAIITANNDNTRAILDKMCQYEIQSLRDTNQAYALQLSQQAQTANLLEQLQPVSKPAYITCSPYQSSLFPFGFYGFNGFNGYNNGNCNCGC